MFSDHIEKTLTQVERHFDDASAALVSGEPLALLSASTALRQGAIDLSTLLQNLSPKDRKNQELTSRLRRLSEGMAVRRESLARRTVLIERSLNALVPAAQAVGYAPASANGRYGGPGKQTGAFKVLSA